MLRIQSYFYNQNSVKAKAGRLYELSDFSFLVQCDPRCVRKKLKAQKCRGILMRRNDNLSLFLYILTNW